jgi:two-component system NtrC family sensor kinase
MNAHASAIFTIGGGSAHGLLHVGAENNPFDLTDSSQAGALLGRSPATFTPPGELGGLGPVLARYAPDIRSWMVAPLNAAGTSAGALLLGRNTEAAFDDGDLQALASFTRALAGQMHAQMLVQEMQTANAGLENLREQLLHSRNVLRALFDSFPDGLYIIEPDYRLSAVNMQRARRLGAHPVDLVGKICYRALYGRKTPCPECRVERALKYGESGSHSLRGKSPDGEVQEFELHGYPILDTGVSGAPDVKVVGAILLEQDVTDRRRLELTLAQSEKLAAVGQWTASLAHELNNPLTVIIANAQLLEREIPPEDDRREMVDLITRAGDRANQVVRNLLDLARKEEYRIIPTDINVTLQRALTLLQHELVARGVSLAYEPGEGLPAVQASPDHLQGVWLNLLSNALDAFGDHLPPDRQPEIQVKTYTIEDEVCVLIADNGDGIPPEKLGRIFEPFYTTKAPGRGTGLGLSVCQRIVQQHGGRILVESQPGAGARFTVLLPAN